MESSHLVLYGAFAGACFGLLGLLWMILNELKALNYYVRKSAEENAAHARGSSASSSSSHSSRSGGSRSGSGRSGGHAT
jgi:hypothetical protein